MLSMPSNVDSIRVRLIVTLHGRTFQTIIFYGALSGIELATLRLGGQVMLIGLLQVDGLEA